MKSHMRKFYWLSSNLKKFSCDNIVTYTFTSILFLLGTTMSVGTAIPEVGSSTMISPSSVFYFLLIPALSLWYLYWYMSRRHMYKLAEKIPGPKGLPFLGNALELRGKSPDIFQSIYKRSFEYDSVVKFWVGPKLITFLVDPRDIELILSSHVYIDKSTEYDFFKPWLGNGLLISTGQKWRAHRKLIAPTFHLNVLKSFIELFNANSRQTVDKMRKEVGKTFDCHDYMSEATVEILLETAMGVSKKTQDRSGFEYALAVMKMCDILHLRQAKLWMRPNWLFNLTAYGKKQVELLDIIHGLTRKVRTFVFITRIKLLKFSSRSNDWRSLIPIQWNQGWIDH